MPTDLVIRPRPGVGRAGRRPGDGAFDPGGRPPRPAAAPVANSAALCLGFGLAGIVMLFVAFTATYLGHRQDGDWRPLPLPWILWLDTALLLASSGAVEWARRRLARGDRGGLVRGLTVGSVLGAAFLAGQVTAWRDLAQRGVYLASHPHSSFFYLLTGAHAVHLLGGLAALAVILPRAWRGAYAPPASIAVTLTAVYWHFLTVLWVYVFAILFLS